MSDNPEFYSPSGDWFWQDPDINGKHIIGDTIVRDCKRSIMSSYFMTAFLIFAFCYGIFMAVTDFEHHKMFTVFTVGVAPIGIYMFGSSIFAMKRYIIKSQEGRFRCRHVKVVDRNFSAQMTSNSFMVYIQSTDEDDNASAEVNVEKTLFDRMAIGLTGWFVMIDGEKKKMLVSPYWFISDTDSKASVAPLTKIEGSKGTAPSEEKIASIKKAWRNAHAVRIGMTVFAALAFIMAGVYMLAGILAGTDNSIDGSYVLMGLMLGTLGAIVISIFLIADIFRGKRILLVVWAVWLNMNMFGLFFMTLNVFGTPVKLAGLFVVFILNLCTVWIMNSSLIKNYREIAAGRYLVKTATVQSINASRHFVFPIILLTTLTCIVADSNSNAFEVDITGSQGRRLKEGTKGTLISLEKDTNLMFFFEDN